MDAFKFLPGKEIIPEPRAVAGNNFQNTVLDIFTAHRSAIDGKMTALGMTPDP